MSPSNPWRHPPAVPRCEKPRAEGRFYLPSGRRLGYAEFGDPNGAVVLWFHGTPGGRRQFPLVGRRAAERLGLRVVLIERPGSGGIDFLRRVTDVFSAMRRPFAAAVSAMIVPIIPLGHLAYRGVSAIMPDGDKRVFADPDIEAMFIDDIVLAARGGFQAMVDDGRLFGRDWGFRLKKIAAPVSWWHGDADAIVLFDDAKQAIGYLSNVELILMPDESHLGGFAAADDVLMFLRSHL